MSNPVKSILIFEALRHASLFGGGDGGRQRREEESGGGWKEIKKENRPSYLILLFWTLFAPACPFSPTNIGPPLQPEIGFLAYGSPCDSSEECNANLWLECSEVGKKCNCTQPGTTLYEENSGRCKAQIGSSCFRFRGIGPHCESGAVCKLITEEEVNHEDEEDEEEANFLRSYLLSVRSGRPRRSSRKKSDFYQGICEIPRRKLGESCEGDHGGGGGGMREREERGGIEEKESCDEGLKCIQGKCACDSEAHQLWSPERGKCLILPGRPCHPRWKSLECSSHASCKGDVKVRHKKITDFTCQCNQGASLRRSGKECKINHMEACQSLAKTKVELEDCNPDKFLSCSNGRCICRNPLHQIYSERSQSCLTLVGSNCTERRTDQMGEVDKGESPETFPSNPACTENARCHRGKCKCMENFWETSARTCQLGLPFDSPCQESQCHGEKGLICRRGRCACLDPATMNYHKEQEGCVASGGSPCGTFNISSRSQKGKTGEDEDEKGDTVDRSSREDIHVACQQPGTCKKTSSGSFQCVI